MRVVATYLRGDALEEGGEALLLHRIERQGLSELHRNGPDLRQHRRQYLARACTQNRFGGTQQCGDDQAGINFHRLAADARFQLQLLQRGVHVQDSERLDAVHQQVADDAGQAVERGIARCLDLQPALIAHPVAAILGQPAIDVVARREGAKG